MSPVNYRLAGIFLVRSAHEPFMLAQICDDSLIRELTSYPCTDRHSVLAVH